MRALLCNNIFHFQTQGCGRCIGCNSNSFNVCIVFKMSDILNDVKVNIRAILLSAPNGVPIYSISKEFMEMTGYAIPYQRLGYARLEDLIYDLSDVVSVRDVCGAKYLFGIADKSTAHIQKLVSKQRKPSVKYNPSFARGPPSYRKSFFTGDRYYQDHSKGYQDHSKGLLPHPNTFSENVQSRTTSIPEPLKVQIRELMKSYPQGINVSSFNSAFHRKYSYTLDERRLGFDSFIDLLACAKDCVLLKNTGKQIRVYPLNLTGKPERLPFEIRDHIDRLVRRAIGKYPRVCEGGNELESATLNSFTSEGNFKSGDSWQEKHNNNLKKEVSQPLYSHSWQPSPVQCDSVSNSSEVSESKVNPKLPEPEIQEPEVNELKAVEASNEEDCSGSTQVSKLLVKEFYQILDKNKDGIWSRMLPAKYKEETNKDLDINELGFLSVIELVQTIPHVFRIERPSELDWLLLDARKPYQAEPNLLPKAVPLEPPPVITEKGDLEEVSSNVKIHLEELLSLHPAGFLVSELPQIYKKYTGEDFPSHDKDFEALEIMLSSKFTDILQLHYTDCGAKLLPLSKSPASSPKESSPPTYPTDVVDPEFNMVYQPIPQDFRRDPHVEVFVAFIISPDRFWLQFRGSTTSEAMHLLMDEMDEFYNSPAGDKYIISPSYLTVGVSCASRYPDDDHWYRAQIIEIKGNDLIRVRYLDYGNVSHVSRSSIRLLRTKFSNLPAQAISAKLAHIKPPDSTRWSPEAGDRFLELINNKPLIAKILDIQDVVPFLTVTLCDTSGVEDIYIHVVLAKEGLASLDTSRRSPNYLKPLRRPKSPGEESTRYPLSLTPSPDFGNNQRYPLNLTPSPDFGNNQSVYPTLQAEYEDKVKAFRNQNINNSMDASSSASSANGPSPLTPTSLMWSNLQKTSLGPLNFGSPLDSSSSYFRPDLAVNALSNMYLLASVNPFLQMYMKEYSKIFQQDNTFPKTVNSSTFEEGSTANPENLDSSVNFRQQQQKQATVKSPPGLSRSSQPLPSHLRNITNQNRNIFEHDRNETCKVIKDSDNGKHNVNSNNNNNSIEIPTKSFTNQLPNMNSFDLQEPSQYDFKGNRGAPLSSRTSLGSASLSGYMGANADCLEEERDSDSEDSLIVQLNKELDLNKSVQMNTLLDNPVHIITYGNAPHMIGSEISLAIWKKDMLRNMLRIHKFKVENIVISEDEEPILFEELLRYNLIGIGLDDKPSSDVSLYPLESVISIFERFKVSKELLDDIKRIQEEYYQEGVNWQDVSSDVDDCHEFHELQTTLSILLSRCKSVEHQLKYERSAALVDEHEYLMEKIRLVEEQLKKMEAQN